MFSTESGAENDLTHFFEMGEVQLQFVQMDLYVYIYSSQVKL